MQKGKTNNRIMSFIIKHSFLFLFLFTCTIKCSSVVKKRHPYLVQSTPLVRNGERILFYITNMIYYYIKIYYI